MVPTPLKPEILAPCPPKIRSSDPLLKERLTHLLGALQELMEEAAELSKRKDTRNVHTLMKILAILLRVIVNLLKRPRH